MIMILVNKQLIGLIRIPDRSERLRNETLLKMTFVSILILPAIGDSY